MEKGGGVQKKKTKNRELKRSVTIKKNEPGQIGLVIQLYTREFIKRSQQQKGGEKKEKGE